MSDATYTYPGSDDISRVRWYLGDTNADGNGVIADALVSDVEIAFALHEKANDPLAAAAFVARYAAVKLIRGPQSIRLLDFAASSGTSPKQLADYYLALAKRLEGETTRPGIYAGGISKADKAAVEANTDRTPPAFKRGMHDFSSDLDPD